MARGALALFDVLGFKAISRRVDRAQIFAKQRALRDAFRSLETGWPEQFRLRHAFLSDTVLVSMNSPSLGALGVTDGPITQDGLDAMTLLMTSLVTSSILRAGVDTPPSWTYRGCFSFGEHEVEDTFYVGPAVDLAAEHFEKAQGAFVWLTPEAGEIVDRTSGTGEELFFPAHAVPLKGGDVYRTRVVAPLAFNAGARSRRDLVKRILATFTGYGPMPLDVALKKQNTETFLKSQLDVWQSSADEVARMLAQLPEPLASDGRRLFDRFIGTE